MCHFNKHRFREVFDDAFDRGITVVRTPPADDGVPLALAACRRGDSLILVADMTRARRLAIALRRAGVTVALGPDDWAAAAAGATVVGTRSAAWSRTRRCTACPLPSASIAF